MLNTNKLAPQVLVLRFMREKRKLSLLDVGKKTGIKPKDIDYMENGKKIISEDQLQIFLKCYRFSFEVYSELLALNPLNKLAANHYFLARKIY